MLAFEGHGVPVPLQSFLSGHDVAGFTLGRYRNVESAGQIRALTDELQAARLPGRPPLLIAADQEGGQLIGLGEDTTAFAGNMALGATADPALAERVGMAMGRELRALGVNVDYAPVCDVATNPANPSLGIRAFGDHPGVVAELAAATVRGLQAAGVAATLKHFPGKGEATVDPHHGLPLLDLDLVRLEEVELVPFRAGVEAGARLVMVGHYDLPAVTEQPDLPTSLSPRVMGLLLRDRLRFDGVIITDALDMGALPRGPGRVPDVVAAVRAGADLLLCGPRDGDRDRILSDLEVAASGGVIDPDGLAGSSNRVSGLREWTDQFPQPPLETVGSAEHRGLARELAERSVTMVRNDAGLVPIRLGTEARVAAVMPQPRDLTPADTSSTVVPSLASALRRHHPRVEQFATSQTPAPGEIADLRHRATSFDLIVVGTIDAFRQPEQAAMVRELMGTGIPMVAVALRSPWDLALYPEASSYACTYGILPPSLDALAAALWGEIPFRGKLPVAIPGLYPRGHGLG